VEAHLEDIGAHLLDRNLTVGTVESATGGLISDLLTNMPGSSRFYKGSIVAYSNEIKTGIVGVQAATIEEHGAVSAEVAEEMAAGGRRVLGVDICISDTGIAGPTGGSHDKPVGLFYMGFSYKGGTYSRRVMFQGERLANKQSAAVAALDWVEEFLDGKWVPGLS
jgi:PncC family amidohydrolase